MMSCGRLVWRFPAFPGWFVTSEKWCRTKKRSPFLPIRKENARYPPMVYARIGKDLLHGANSSLGIVIK